MVVRVCIREHRSDRVGERLFARRGRHCRQSIMKPTHMLCCLAFAACYSPGDEHCGPSRCDGANLQTCSLVGNDVGRTASWHGTPCPGACVPDQAGGGAFCAESATPIPECLKGGDICYHGAAA